MMDLQKKMRRSSVKKIAKLLLLGLSLNIAGSAFAIAAQSDGGSFNKEMLEQQKTEKEAVNQFYDAFLKNQVEQERLEEKERQELRHAEGYDAAHPVLPKIFEVESMKLLMRYFDDSRSDKEVTSGAYFSENVYTDLNVFPDQTGKHVTVFSDFANLTNTGAGKLGLLEMLSNPLCNLDKLRERQKVIELLSKDTPLFNEINAALTKFGKAEKSLLYFIKTKDDGNNRDDFRRYFDENIPSNGGRFVNNALWYGGLTGRMVPSALCAAYMLFSTYQLAKFPGNFIPFAADAAENQGLNLSLNKLLTFRRCDGTERYCATSQNYAGCNRTQHNFYVNQYMRLALILASFYGMKKSWDSFVTPRAEMGKRFQACMIDLTDIIDATKEIAEAISKNDTLATAIPGCKGILSSIEGRDGGELKSILDMFDGSAFNGKISATGPKGQIFKAFGVMCEKADKFTEIMRFVSRLDATMAVVKALRASAKNPARYCIPKFLKAEDGKPYLRATKFWHPTLDPRKVVTNDIELGNTFRNIILTGANAGGKTTWMQALALLAVLAQTFGIVPAESAAITPFALVIADTKVVTTIGKESMYENEVRKLIDATEKMQSLGADKFALYIVDEPLKGSNAVQCATEAYKAIRRFGLQKNALVVVATHFEKLTELGDQDKADAAIKGIFANYKVDSRLYECAKYKDSKFLQQTYKVIPGVITEIVTGYMLDEAYKKHNLISMDATEHLPGMQEVN
ncbi:MAG: hypothetical protein US49_C0007G0012 [candidate division TM6 bacterium GW2011_GWF2_37_49]|nr:MAG: hypothetical protein US49_C0007G0012 [candidate division TM6 bacterium GW2011_GWF2_37_49]